MPIHRVDLAATLPVLEEYAKPFVAAVVKANATLGSQGGPTTDALLIRTQQAFATITLGEARKLMLAIEAVRRMADAPE